MRRLYRPNHDRVIAGVCGGLAEYFGVDSVLVRLAYAALAFMGIGILAYPIAVIIIPNAPTGHEYSIYDEEEGKPVAGVARTNVLLGTGLVLVGAYLLFQRFILPLIPAIYDDLFWPLVLIFLGWLLLLRRKD